MKLQNCVFPNFYLLSPFPAGNFLKIFTLSFEHGYFDSIGSGREFQFFSAHFILKSRKDTRVGALDRYTLPTYVKIIEKSCNFFQKSF